MKIHLTIAGNAVRNWKLPNDKKCLVSRYGAWGDHIVASIIYPLLKKDGYHVTLNLMKRALPVVLHNPNIDRLIFHDESIPNEKLEEHWNELSKGYYRFINLSESIEGSLLKVHHRDDFNLPKEELDKLNDINYYDRTLEIAGYGHIKGHNGHLYFTKGELKWGERERRKNNGKFIFLWVLSGSSFHKAYPYTEQVAVKFLERHPDSVCYLVGDTLCELLTWDHPRTKSKIAIWDIRKTMLMTKFVDLVIGPETGVLNAAGCFNTPKILFLSHSTHNNLSKYWNNVFPVFAQVPCYPCHKLHYELNSCPLNQELLCPVCMANINPDVVLDTMEDIYWRVRNGSTSNSNIYHYSN